MSDRTQEWLVGLQIGDEVAVRPRYCGLTAISRVERVTPTLVIAGGTRYRKSDGREPGDGYGKQSLCIPTQEIRDAWDESRMRAVIKRAVESKDTTTAKIRAMYDALTAKDDPTP